MLPTGYTPPEQEKKSDGYLNTFVEGVTRLRILSSIEPGYEWWLNSEGANIGTRKIVKGDKPVRVKDLKDVTNDPNSEPYKHFWVMTVYNYGTTDKNGVSKPSGKVQIWEVKQSTIQGAIAGFEADPDYGDSMGYDISITRKGMGFDDTVYSVIPKPPKPLDETVSKAKRDNPIDLGEWFAGGNPFIKDDKGEAQAEKEYSQGASDITDDIPF